MQASAIPSKMPLTFGSSAGSSYLRTVPNPSQISTQAGAASYTDGFPPVCFTPVGSGGTPPFGQDFNGLLKQITAWCQWYQAGGWSVQQYDASFSSSGTYNIGGYPKGAVLANASTLGLFWLSLADNNTTDPDTGGANWLSISFGNQGNRVITSSSSVTLLLTDVSVGFNRTTSLANTNATLPAATSAQIIKIRDLAYNFNTYPVTVLASSGTTFPGGSASFVLNENGMSADFELYPSASIWGVGVMG
jgi:hypothetical protein